LPSKHCSVSLNTLIDQFVTLADKDGVDPVELEKAQESIFSVSSDLAAETANPVGAILRFGTMVRSRGA
jgi:hypothetical protein